MGPDVTGLAVGDEVVAFAQRAAMADFAVVDAAYVGRKAPGLGFAPAAVVPAAGATAWATVNAVQPVSGETVFVSAASGGVGVLAAQLARLVRRRGPTLDRRRQRRPILIHGNLTVTAPGREPQPETRIALCGCGRSAKRPFCDNACHT